MKLLKLLKKNLRQPEQEEKKTLMIGNLLQGKNVLITGAGKNIGRSIALEMAQQEANIYFTEMNKESLIQLEETLKKYPVKSKGFVCDISNADDIDSLYNILLQEKIKIDVLVNNVGISIPTKGLKDFDHEEWNKIFSINVFGPMHLTKLITRMMINNNIEGSVIFLSSIHQWTVRRYPSYSATKGALGMIIKELAIDLAPNKIRVNGIAPGNIEEDENGTPVGDRYTFLYNSSINPCYIGRAAVYLSSEYFSKFTTGTVLKIDAGLSLYTHSVNQFPPNR